MDNWHNFYFNAFDPGGVVSLDKPPIAIWMQVLSAKVFGFSAITLLLPQVIEGLLAVSLVYWMVQRAFGRAAGLIAAFPLALTTVSTRDKNLMKRNKLTGLAFTAALLPIVAAGAAEVISGRDAAYIDWAVRNCAVKSSAKEHGLIDQSKLINETAFTRDYMSAFQSKVLADAISTPQKTDTLCTEIKAWYGPIGSRIADLLVWAEAPPPDKPKAATATAKGDGGRRGHRGQQQ